MRKRERERDILIEGETSHQLAVSCTVPAQDSNLQPFGGWDGASTNCVTPPRARIIYILYTRPCVLKYFLPLCALYFHFLNYHLQSSLFLF